MMWQRGWFVFKGTKVKTQDRKGVCVYLQQRLCDKCWEDARAQTATILTPTIQQGAHSAQAEWPTVRTSNADSHLNTIWQKVAYSFLAEDTCDQNCSHENSCFQLIEWTGGTWDRVCSSEGCESIQAHSLKTKGNTVLKSNGLLPKYAAYCYL